ncbi:MULTISPECIES: hypothetical protein [unclassified Luteimonas]|uniref:hypothetical protein n=1 Tax=unclassified Luteimonas TaxID=2629088 RepID=UPI0031BB682B
MTVSRPLPLLCLLATLAVAGTAHGDDGRPSRRGQAQPPRAEAPIPGLPPPAQRSARRDALSDSVRRVQSRTGGQVLSAERVPFDGRDINRVKVVDDRGRVRVYMDDPDARPRRAARPTRGDDD